MNSHTSVDFSESVDTGTTQVQVTGDRRTSHVEPVGVGRRQLVEHAGLDQVVPHWHFKFSGP